MDGGPHGVQVRVARAHQRTRGGVQQLRQPHAPAVLAQRSRPRPGGPRPQSRRVRERRPDLVHELARIRERGHLVLVEVAPQVRRLLRDLERAVRANAAGPAPDAAAMAELARDVARVDWLCRAVVSTQRVLGGLAKAGAERGMRSVSDTTRAGAVALRAPALTQENALTTVSSMV